MGKGCGPWAVGHGKGAEVVGPMVRGKGLWDVGLGQGAMGKVWRAIGKGHRVMVGGPWERGGGPRAEGSGPWERGVAAGG